MFSATTDTDYTYTDDYGYVFTRDDVTISEEDNIMFASDRTPLDEDLRDRWRKVEKDILALYDLPKHEGWEKIKLEIDALVKEQYRREQEEINGNS